MRIYLAGPMRGIPHFNFPAFDEAADNLRYLGHEVFSPADHDRKTYGEGVIESATGDEREATAKGFDLRATLGADLAWIAAEAQAVAVLPGWEASRGAAAEVALAHALRIPVVRVSDLLSNPSFTVIHFAIPAPELPPIKLPPLRGRSLFDDMGRLDIIADDPGNDEPTDDRYTDAVHKPSQYTSHLRGELITTSRTGGQKGVKPQRYDLIPALPLRLLAEHYGVGALKYADNQWRKGYEWSKSFAALQRHAWQWQAGETFDVETGSNHMAAVAWHAFALLQYAADHPEFDDRPTS